MSQKDKQPVRPPRLTRATSKESSSGLLMSVIRSLTASRDTDERDREKANLQREYQESDRRLDKLVVQHHTDLIAVMQAFSKISVRLESAKSNLTEIREKLTTCQSLLHCKKDELRRLWHESIENKHVLQLLDLIEDQSQVPDRVSAFISDKHYLHATRLILSSLKTLDSEVKSVEALTEVKNGLLAKKEEMFHLLIDELHRHIYVRSTSEVVKKMKRQDLDRKAVADGGSVSVADMLSSAALRNPCVTTGSIPSPQPPDDPLSEDLHASDPEQDWKHFIAILIECLSLSNKIPETIHVIKERADKELGNIVKRTGRELFDGSALSSNPKVRMINVQGQNLPDHLLQGFIDGLMAQFRCVVEIHETVVLVHLKRVTAADPIDLYTMSEIWNKVQSVVEVVADYCTNLNESKTEKEHPVDSEIRSYFSRKRNENAAEKQKMFRFDLSSPAMIFNAYLEEQQT